MPTIEQTGWSDGGDLHFDVWVKTVESEISLPATSATFSCVAYGISKDCVPYTDSSSL